MYLTMDISSGLPLCRASLQRTLRYPAESGFRAIADLAHRHPVLSGFPGVHHMTSGMIRLPCVSSGSLHRVPARSGFHYTHHQASFMDRLVYVNHGRAVWLSQAWTDYVHFPPGGFDLRAAKRGRFWGAIYTPQMMSPHCWGTSIAAPISDSKTTPKSGPLLGRVQERVCVSETHHSETCFHFCLAGFPSHCQQREGLPVRRRRGERRRERGSERGREDGSEGKRGPEGGRDVGARARS